MSLAEHLLRHVLGHILLVFGRGCNFTDRVQVSQYILIRLSAVFVVLRLRNVPFTGNSDGNTKGSLVEFLETVVPDEVVPAFLDLLQCGFLGQVHEHVDLKIVGGIG